MKAVVSEQTEKSLALLRKVLGATKRELTGPEYDHAWTMLQLMEPTVEYNNQHSWTEEYTVGKTWYRVTYWPAGGHDEPETTIELFGEEDE